MKTDKNAVTDLRTVASEQQSSTLDAIRQDSPFCSEHLHNTLAESKACKRVASRKRDYLEKVRCGEIKETPAAKFNRLNFPLSFWNYVLNK